MNITAQVTYRRIARSDALEDAIRRRVARLDKLHPNVASCRVVVEQLGRHRNSGNEFAVRLDVHVPGVEFAVTHRHDEDVYVALRDAFDAAERRIEDLARIARGDVKTHAMRVPRDAQ